MENVTPRKRKVADPDSAYLPGLYLTQRKAPVSDDEDTKISPGARGLRSQMWVSIDNKCAKCLSFPSDRPNNTRCYDADSRDNVKAGMGEKRPELPADNLTHAALRTGDVTRHFLYKTTASASTFLMMLFLRAFSELNR
jgi:hypothetical protein